jgi:hypothetical protein
MKITLIFMFYSNLDVNRTVKNEFGTKIDPKPLRPPLIPFGNWLTLLFRTTRIIQATQNSYSY